MSDEVKADEVPEQPVKPAVPVSAGPRTYMGAQEGYYGARSTRELQRGREGISRAKRRAWWLRGGQ